MEIQSLNQLTLRSIMRLTGSEAGELIHMHTVQAIIDNPESDNLRSML